jgi:mRNA interferase RelE/StbE
LAWTIEVAETAQRQLRKLDRPTARRIVDYLNRLVSEVEHPRQRGKPLTAKLAGLWRYRVGDVRLICRIEDQRLVVLLLRLGHRI